LLAIAKFITFIIKLAPFAKRKEFQILPILPISNIYLFIELFVYLLILCRAKVEGIVRLFGNKKI